MRKPSKIFEKPKKSNFLKLHEYNNYIACEPNLIIDGKAFPAKISKK